MNSREIVRRTLEFDGPERVARSFEPSDMVFARHQAKTHETEWVKAGENRWTSTDEWGNTWHRLDPTSKGEVAESVLDNLDELDAYEFPDFSNPKDYESVREARRQHPGHWLVGAVPGFAFNISRKLRKLDQYLMDLALEPGRIRILHDRVDEVVAAMIRNYAEAGVDAIMFWEDWGMQNSLLIDPNVWKAEFFPRFEKLCAIAHDMGIKVMMHSCGQITSIVPWLCEAGIDTLQFDQPTLHGIDTLTAHQADHKITFWCPVDIQKTLQTRNENGIRAGARQMLDKLWKGRGGFIAGYYDDNESIGLDPEWQGYACDEFVKCGVAGRYEENGA